MTATALPDPAAARKTLIALMGLSVKGARVKYKAETEAQAAQAFDLAAGIAAQARAPFKVLAVIREIQHPTGGAVMFRHRPAEGDGEVVE